MTQTAQGDVIFPAALRRGDFALISPTGFE
jgi:hypothetical protein